MTLSNVDTRINAFRRILFGEKGRSEQQFHISQHKILHMVGAVSVDFEKLIDLANAITSSTYWKIETSLYNGLYISIDKQASFFVIQPGFSSISLSPEQFNQSIEGQLTEELLIFASKNNIDELNHIHFGIFWGLVEAYLNCLTFYFDLTKDQLNNIKLVNSHNQFRHWYKNISTGSFPEKKLYLDIFSKQYFIEIQIISKLFENAQPVYIHDVATNSGNLPSLINSLYSEHILPFELGGLDCSDYNTSAAIHNINVITQKFNYKSSIKVSRMDLKSPNISFGRANVIIANDVLEHFEDYESFQVLANLWKNTADILIVHVPIEATPAKHFGHLTQFTKEKLKLWADHLESCKNMTDELLGAYQDKFFIDGFLILKKYNL